MASFCRFCGKSLNDGEVCDCQQSQAQQQQVPPQQQAQQQTPPPQAGPSPIQQTMNTYRQPIKDTYHVEAFSIMTFLLGLGSIIGNGIVSAILAIVFACFAKKHVKADDLLGDRLYKAGFILACVGIIILIISAIVACAVASSSVSALDRLFNSRY